MSSWQPSTMFAGPLPSANVTHRYLSTLPASDNTSPIPDADVTTDPLQAQFVEVTIGPPLTIPTIFPASFFGGSNSIAGVATAVAGFTQNVCKFTPMYVCNPWEPIGNTDYNAASQLLFQNDVADPDAIQHRQMISMRYDPGGSTKPGSYGFLVGTSPGAAALIDSIARNTPPLCFSRSGVTTQTGFLAQAIANGFNVRFDIYKGSMAGKLDNASYAPARDVRKGYIGTGCNQTPSSAPAALALPFDNPAGSGTWDFNTYWAVEHPGVAPPTVTNPVTNITSTWGNAIYLPSRYTAKNYEVAQAANPGGLNDRSPGLPPSTPGETGNSTCSSQVPPASVDRRILFSAIINCQALTASGVLRGRKNTDIPVAAFGKFFLLQPVDQATGDVDAEFVGLVDKNDYVVRNVVQLYR
jgi:hypothetical protein